MIPLHDEVRMLRDLGAGRRQASLKAWTARRLPVAASPIGEAPDWTGADRAVGGAPVPSRADPLRRDAPEG